MGVQKNENIRLQQCLTTLKSELVITALVIARSFPALVSPTAEKTMLHQQIIAMQHMVDELEEEIGSE